MENKSVNPLVSIIVPVYNTEQYLAQCVDSLLCQTLENIEIILIDDGSTDNCHAICDAYAGKDNRVRVIHQQNSGYGKACNTGIKAARSEFFGIIESDDYAEPDMFECLYKLAKTNDLDVVRCHYYLYNSQVNTHEKIDLSYIPQNVVCSPQNTIAIFSQAPSVWSMLYRKNLILENNLFFLETPGASYQDTSFVFKVYACTGRFMLTDKAFVHYRIDNENSSIASREKVFRVCDEYREIKRFLTGKNIYEEYLPIIPKIQFSTYMWNYRRIKKHRWPFLKKFAREMRGYIFKNVIKDSYSIKEVCKIYAIAFCYPFFFAVYHPHN